MQLESDPTTMTSPNNKAAAEKTPQKKMSPVHNSPAIGVAADPSVDGTSMLPPSNTTFRSCGMFAWLKVFRYADLLMRQGC